MKIYWINLFGIAAFAILLGCMFLSAFTPNNQFIVPISYVFFIIGMLASATGAAVRAIINRLEQIAPNKGIPDHDGLKNLPEAASPDSTGPEN